MIAWNALIQSQDDWQYFFIGAEKHHGTLTAFKTRDGSAELKFGWSSSFEEISKRTYENVFRGTVADFRKFLKRTFKDDKKYYELLLSVTEFLFGKDTDSNSEDADLNSPAPVSVPNDTGFGLDEDIPF